MTLAWSDLAVLPVPRFEVGHLIALENVQGVVLALGVVTEIRDKAGEVVLCTALTDSENVDAIRLGSLALDSQTFQERRVRVPG